jgi:hypothetical protein
MTPKEKEKELGNKYLSTGMLIRQPKECATIAVDEILSASLYYFDELSPYVIYWQQVKQEIEKL